MTEAEKERAAVVAWLRKRAKDFWEWGNHSLATEFEDAAIQIALGDHTKED